MSVYESVKKKWSKNEGGKSIFLTVFYEGQTRRLFHRGLFLRVLILGALYSLGIFRVLIFPLFPWLLDYEAAERMRRNNLLPTPLRAICMANLIMLLFGWSCGRYRGHSALVALTDSHGDESRIYVLECRVGLNHPSDHIRIERWWVRCGG
jgi:hypothetical protein